MAGMLGFNPYSIQGIVHRHTGEEYILDIKRVSILTQYKALFIQNSTSN